MAQESRPHLKINSPSEKHWDETFRLISWWDAERMQQSKIMVVGAGALGNEVLKNLALLNAGHLLIVDFDIIKYHNLSRSVLFREKDCGRKKATVAAERIREMNPNVSVKSIEGDISIDVGLGVFRRMDAIVGCLDNRVARLFINRHCFKVGKSWVDGAIENLAGQLDVFKPGLACYECQLEERELSDIHRRWGCPDVAARNDTFGKIPTTPISASIIGAMQAQEAMKIVFGNEQQSMSGQRFKYEGMSNMILQYGSSPLNEDCPSHSEIDEIVEARTLSCSNTVKETLDWLENHFKDPNPTIMLDDDLVLEFTTRESEATYEIIIPRGHISEQIIRQYQQVPGEELILTQTVRSLDRDFPHQGLSLKEAGIPPLHILTVYADNDIKFVELCGDEDFLAFG